MTTAEIWRIGDFGIFQDGGRPPYWIFKSWTILTVFRVKSPNMRKRRNLVPIDPTVADIWRFLDF